MARNKFLKTLAGLLNSRSHSRKSRIKQGYQGFVDRQNLGQIDPELSSLSQEINPQSNRYKPSRRWRRFLHHKLGRSFLSLLEAIAELFHRFTVKVFYRLWRNVFVGDRQKAQAGFVLPVTVLMVIVILLVVTSLMFRSYQRSVQVIGDFQTQEVQNAATPAVERAKAKLELMFSDKEGGIYTKTSGLPSESLMETLLLNKKDENDQEETEDYEKYYKFPDEEWIQLYTDGDDNPGTNAGWKFRTDANGDGDTDDPDDLTTAYTIVFRSTKPIDENTLKTVDPKLLDPDNNNTAGDIEFKRFEDEKEKASYLVVSNGPIIPQKNEANDASCQVTIDPNNPDRPEVKGWFSVSTAVMMKDFQVYAVSVPNRVANGDGGNAAISTILYQQDRTVKAGNAWGAWFRNDIEINPGFEFNWNGAMHTEGSIFTRPEKDTFRYYLISGKNSCFYLPETNSGITTRGHFVNSLLWANSGAFTGTVEVDRYEDPTESITLTNALDSVDDSKIDQLSDLALNPLKILTKNESEPTDDTIDFAAVKDGNWDNSDISYIGEKRVSVAKASSSPPPYVDDTYRADSIYGPKPGYDRPKQNAAGQYTVTPSQQIGSDIDNSNQELIREKAPALEPENYGLDGYWERRARGDGMRVIVGQRLELGNAYGWNPDLDGDGNPDPDPLNPPDVDPKDNTTYITNLARQRRAQRDNLAAVQATLVYHQDSGDGYVPAAVVATTVHPGTLQTLTDSATFEQIEFEKKSDGTFQNIATDFFYGHGTNGWEFYLPESASWDFQTPNSGDMSKALSNLANFAGDPDGAFPPTQEDSDGDPVHPYPYLRMWGDYSNLRRALNGGNGSLAERTTIQTAAATLGLLAYNIDYLQEYDYASNQTSGLGGGLEVLGNALWVLQDSLISNGEVVPLISDGFRDDGNGGTGAPLQASDYILPPDAYIAALENNKTNNTFRDDVANLSSSVTNLTEDDVEQVIKLARLVMTKEQVKRDRTYGFRISPANHQGNGGTYDPTDGIASWVNATVQINSACNVSSTGNGNNYFGLGTPNATTEKQFIGLSRLCSNQPKFPSLYYIFPKVDHDHNGDTDPVDGVNNIDHTQPDGVVNAPDPGELYITDPYITRINTGNYEALDDANIASIALQPYANSGEFQLPTNDAGNGTNPVSTEWDYILDTNGSLTQVALKDSAFFDGREEMSVRALNLDLDMLRQTTVKSDTWLPKSGMIYGFREDAVREDAIARPRNTMTYSSYETSYLTTPGVMDANKNIDPPVYNVDTGGSQDDSATKGISPKPVDYYADPDRRPYGFRLKHGNDLRRNNSNDVLAGLTFVSDNPTYIQGNFNGHGNNNEIRELTGDATGDNFYNRDRNNDFGDPQKDSWRPAEVLADAVTILSNSFCDGSVADAYRLSNIKDPNSDDTDLEYRYGCDIGAQYTSYLSQNRPNYGTPNNWVREFEGDTESPILFSRNGFALYNNSGTIEEYDGSSDTEKFHLFSDVLGNGSHGRKTPLVTDDAWVNVVMISGNVPSRENQGNGGLHNFPRLLERWNKNKKTLRIRGSFIQLNFSNYATAPYERDAWEPRKIGNGDQKTTMQGANCNGDDSCEPNPGTKSTDESNSVNILFYGAPERDWGYDVGLQFLPSGPISRRLVIPEDPRSEFYREPKADNAYICQLRKQIGFPCTEE